MSEAVRRQAVPKRMIAYVSVVAICAVGLTPASLVAHGASHGLTALLEALALAGMIGWARRRPVQIGLKRRISVSTAPELAAVLLLPGPVALVTLLAGMLAGQHGRRGPLIQHIFNYSSPIIRAVLGMVVFTGVRELGPAAISEPAAALGAAFVMHCTAQYLVVGIAAVQLRENPLRRAWAGQRDTAVAETALALTGIMTWLATAQHAWALAMLAAPLAIAHYALRDGVALRAQTRLALEDLADIVDMRDHYTFEHSRRVAELARVTARCLGLANADVELVTMAGRVHDVGKIGIKSSVLMKPGGLSDRDWQEMRSHPEVGARLIGNFPQFANGRDLVLHHHERFDGKGYPKGLAGDQIPFGARILACADAWDAMTSHRAYRRALDIDQVYGELERGRGKQFDPTVLDAFLRALHERPDLAIIHVDTSQEIDVGHEPAAQVA
ncbi:MAG: HD-GYP domain-containing protein [Dehalococcoidia bacterium]